MKINTINQIIDMVNGGDIGIQEATTLAMDHDMDYALKYFSPNRDQLAYWDIREEWTKRKNAAPKKPAPVAEFTLPTKQGQLWEGCRKCGREPVYMPLHLCDKCWPTT
jgi:hypothetical protein